jgi:hypothetical protein
MPASGTGDFIVSAVVKANSIGSYHNIIDDDASNRPMLWIDPSFNYELNFAGGSGAKGVGTGTDGWDIVIADSRTGMLYVNSATANATGGGAVAYFAGKAFDLFNRDGGQTFQGLVAELQVYNDAETFSGFAALHQELNDEWFAPTDVPAPASVALLLIGFAGMVAVKRRKA